MDFAGERYYKLNRIILLALGLWPYQISILKKIQIIFFQALFISFLVFQCNTFFVKQYSYKTITNVLLFITITCIGIIIYNGTLLLGDNIKYIFDRVRYDWNMLKTEAELKVIQRYAAEANIYTISFILIISGSSLAYFIIITCLPISVLNVIVPMNESRSRQLVIYLEYFVDQDTYFYAILTHITLINFIGQIAVASIKTTLSAYIFHICALFEIASHRIGHIIPDENVELMPKNIKQYILYKKLIHAVYIHRRAVDLVNFWVNSFTILYFVLIGCIIVSFSLNIFNVINAIASLEILDCLVYGTILFTQLYYIFLGNYMGQTIIDNSINICQATYNIEWYAMPLCIQKLMLFIMQRSNKKSVLKAGGLFDASLEGLASLISMSISYVIILQSVQEERK